MHTKTPTKNNAGSPATAGSISTDTSDDADDGHRNLFPHLTPLTLGAIYCNQSDEALFLRIEASIADSSNSYQYRTIHAEVRQSGSSGEWQHRGFLQMGGPRWDRKTKGRLKVPSGFDLRFYASGPATIQRFEGMIIT